MMLKLPPEVLDGDERYHSTRKNLFWDLSKKWFLERGYHLYERVEPEWVQSRPALPSEPNVGEDPYPFAFYAGSEAPDAESTSVLFAQDAQGRHVVLKPLKMNSDENRILRILYHQRQVLGDSGWQRTHILPIFDFLDSEDGRQSFAVMPRWGDSFYSLDFQHIYEVFDFLHAALSALTFLHKLKIVHHDISLANFLVNQIDASYWPGLGSKRADLRERRQLKYALFDFNVSLSFSLDATAEECRRPYWQSYYGDMIYQPPDTQQGEHDYDPFAFDVGCLGLLFCDFAQTSTLTVPMLAPFLDRMIARDTKKRFTSSQALEFLTKIEDELTDDQHMARYPGRLSVNSLAYETYDRWRGLPTAFVKQWSQFREPPVPLLTRILRRVCISPTSPWMELVIIHIRKYFAYLSRFSFRQDK